MKKIKPTEAELEVLMVLWKEGPSTVRTVFEKVHEPRKIGYTTTLKILQIMHEKGLVERDESARTHIYTAAAKEQDMQKALLSDFLKSAFSGSTSKLVMQALGNHKTSSEELQRIKDLIKKIEEGGEDA